MACFLLSSDFPFSVMSMMCSTGSTGTNLIRSLFLFSTIFSTRSDDMKKRSGENCVDCDDTDSADEDEVKNVLSFCFMFTLTFRFSTFLWSIVITKGMPTCVNMGLFSVRLTLNSFTISSRDEPVCFFLICVSIQMMLNFFTNRIKKAYLQ